MLRCVARARRKVITRGRQKIVREILGLYPLINRREDSPRNRFSVTSEDVREAEKAAREQELEVVGWFKLASRSSGASQPVRSRSRLAVV